MQNDKCFTLQVAYCCHASVRFPLQLSAGNSSRCPRDSWDMNWCEEPPADFQDVPDLVIKSAECVFFILVREGPFVRSVAQSRKAPALLPQSHRTSLKDASGRGRPPASAALVEQLKSAMQRPRPRAERAIRQRMSA